MGVVVVTVTLVSLESVVATEVGSLEEEEERQAPDPQTPPTTIPPIHNMEMTAMTIAFIGTLDTLSFDVWDRVVVGSVW